MRSALVALLLALALAPSHATGATRCAEFLQFGDLEQGVFGAGVNAAFAAVAAKHLDSKNQYFSALRELPVAHPGLRPETRAERTALTVVWNEHKLFEEALDKAGGFTSEDTRAALGQICRTDPDMLLPRAVSVLLEERTKGTFEGSR